MTKHYQHVKTKILYQHEYIYQDIRTSTNMMNLVRVNERDRSGCLSSFCIELVKLKNVFNKINIICKLKKK